jgi:pyridoxine 5-phosphate synthase
VGVRARGHGEGASRLIRLSVNVNKVATIRNSRGGTYPDPLEAAKVVVETGAPGVTVHPREDQRHIRPEDVRAIAKMLAPFKGRVEFNIEGDPRPGLISLVREVRPDQCTLVPVRPGEVTSQAGWPPETPRGPLSTVIGDLHDWGVRVSLFVDPEPDPIRWAADLGADRIELYTEPYARAWERGPDAARASFDRYARAATLAHDLGLGVNAGHDLDLDNLTLFRRLPHLDEVSIGHAIIGRAVFVGLATVVREYLSVLAAT